MILTDLQVAIIGTLHTEPHYCFTQNERKAAERMEKAGLLKLRRDKPQYSETYYQANPPRGKRYSVTPKGEDVYMEHHAEKYILAKSWSVFIQENGINVGLCSVDISPMRTPSRKYSGIWISRIKTPAQYRRKGHATNALTQLLKACRFYHVDAYLIPAAYGEFDGGLNGKQLMAWYKRLGFKEVDPVKLPTLLRYAGKP